MMVNIARALTSLLALSPYEFVTDLAVRDHVPITIEVTLLAKQCGRNVSRKGPCYDRSALADPVKVAAFKQYLL